jgi:glycosyltransferase involved in cell wall biosynthesis
MNNKQNEIINMIEMIEDRKFGFYFFTLDTKGNPTAGIANIYEHVKVLTELGYNAYILHEKDDYHGVGEWLGEEYAKLPHKSIEKQELKLTSVDYIIIPEIFSNVMEQVKAFPCKKIVLSQAYAYALELLKIGQRWDMDYGFKDVITTSERQAKYLKSLFPSIKTHIVPPSIPDYFKPTDKIQKPIISIVTREQSDALKIVKAFYLQNPIYKWLTFRELRGLPRKTFAEQLSDSCLAVWVDDNAGFGTFPLEAIQCNTPVIGKIPNLIPEWMETESDVENQIQLKDNGIWSNNILTIPNLIAEYMKLWLEDMIPPTLNKGMEKSKDLYTEENQKHKIKEVYEQIILDRRGEFENLLNKEKETETKVEEKTI